MIGFKVLQRILKPTILTTTFLREIAQNTRRNCCLKASGGMELVEIVERLEKFAPLSYAESWDNVGLLVEPSSDTHLVSKILLTNDLTERVMNEALEMNVNMILSYHPPIFVPLKCLTKRSWKERVVLKAIENKIAIFSPHTVFDVMENGVNDWLAAGLGKAETIKPLKNTLVDDPVGVNKNVIGVGRLCSLEEEVSLDVMVDRIKKYLNLESVRYASAVCDSCHFIKTVAICAGSGGTVLKGVQADMYLTGEMSHHNILDAVSNGIHVVLGEHSNTERGFLKHYFSNVLHDILDSKVEILISRHDKDPICIA